MVKWTLLNPSQPQMREVVSELLRAICLLNGTTSSCVWLLRVLAALSHTNSTPSAALQPFFTLFKQV